MSNLETFDWLVIILLSLLLISRLVKTLASKQGNKVVDEKDDTVQVSDTRDDEKRYKAD